MNANQTGHGGERRAEALILMGIALLFVALAFAYSLVVPPFEKPDEVYHYAFARHLAQGGDLPVQEIGRVGPWEHEGTQAPLYYFLVGRLTAGIDQADFPALSKLNPRANLGNPLYPGNKNFMLYSAQAHPLAGANLALQIGRWFSIALGLATLLLVYLTARPAFPTSPHARLLATLIVASIPQFAFISSSLSNDSLVTLLSAATIWWLVRLISLPAGRRVAWWEWGVAGVMLGLAALSKLHGLVLLAPVGLVLAWKGWRERSPRDFLAAAGWVALPALTIAGWWYWRNFQLYGDLLGATRLLSINGLRKEPLNWPGFVGEMRGLRYSFWGLFGWFNILLPTWVYRVFDGVTMLALVGFAVAGIRAWLRRRGDTLAAPSARVKALLAIWAVVLVVSMIYWATFAMSSQGRLLFPALSAFAVILVTGLLTWLDFVPRARWPLLGLLPAALLACSVYSLAILLPASYRAPQPLSGIPEGVRQTPVLYDNEIELLGVALPDERFKPGEDVPVTLYLRAAAALPKDLQVFIQLLDENREPVGNVTTHPGWGRNPTSLWQPGAVYEDRYLVRIEKPIENLSPLLADVYVGFIEADSTEPAQATDARGQTVDGIVGQVVIEPAGADGADALTFRPLAVTFGQGIRLTGISYPSEMHSGERALPVTLRYEADAQPDGDYTAFLHLFNSAGEKVKGYDQPPTGARFPTRAWRAGDRVLGQFELLLPGGLAPGVYELWTGLYRSESQGEERLPILDSEQRVEDMRVLLGTVEIR